MNSYNIVAAIAGSYLWQICDFPTMGLKVEMIMANLFV
jgi:hypothetical protein